jgi:hypothetical protein
MEHDASSVASPPSSSAAAKDEFDRLLGLPTRVHPADATMVIRQIRRMLGRFDKHGM